MYYVALENIIKMNELNSSTLYNLLSLNELYPCKFIGSSLK